MDIETARLFFDVFQFAFTCAIALYVWYVRRSQATRAHIDEVGRRVVALETRAEAAPSRDSLHTVSLVVKGIEGDVKAICARLDGMCHVVDRIETVVDRQETYLLTHGVEK